MTLPCSWHAAAGVAALLAAALTTAPAHADGVGPSDGEHQIALNQAVDALPVAAEDRTGYDRASSFGGWIDDHDGCNTRQEVLLKEAVTAPQITGKCTLTPGTGTWRSWYDDTEVASANGLDIDHLVPLAEAWDSGASTWTKSRRVAYANYVNDARHLVAVTAPSNRQKADQDPTTWMPSASQASCRYTADWISVKLTWHLTLDPNERNALTGLADSCPDQTITYIPAT